jgi:hypothetical protein
MDSRATRRAFLGASALIGTGTLGVNGIGDSPIAMAMQDASTPEMEATAPAWRFVVHRYRDPYQDVIIQPATREPGKRYVGAEVSILNESDAALNFTPSSIRLRDVDGVEYSSGAVIGSDPRILDINMIPGERARGWVWFAVPEATEAVEITYVAPSPRLTVPVSAASESGDGGTPVPPQ